MWTCSRCGEQVEDQFDSCWKCSTAKEPGQPAAPGASEGGAGAGTKWRMAYKYFRGTLATWDELFDQAAKFATETGPERVVGISHSADHSNGVVTVWYWEAAAGDPQG